MQCRSCGHENREGRKFCARCGSALAVVCDRCGAENQPDDLFCGECGAPLQSAAPPAAEGATEPQEGVSERRLVSVLFADLVGFTPLSERRDAEEVRDLLSRYFETCRRIVDRYGGTVEKFIGDAVMAVWGSPVAREDDAERAVRAAIELVAAVPGLGGAEDGLRARAGVLTGEAAVTPGAEAEGMVVGDLVNTASRLQSVADPGTVVVGDSTRRATEASVAYEDFGVRELKGKSEPIQTWRAVAVTAGRKGFLKAAGLEAPFVGRDREFRLLKDLFHATSEEGRPHLVSVIGVAGIGKSRLSWEFEKYIDGLVETVLWHRGRCLSYGDGVTYWALGEMVKRRAGIAEEEEPASAASKLRATIERYVPDPEERRFVEPRLAHLLGLEEHSSSDRIDLFSGWRLFFERMSRQNPIVMVFEDLQWADAAMLDFISYLLDWSKDHPVFVVALARPEFLERRPGWGSGTRAHTSVFLEPLSDDAMDDLLRGLVPGLPEDLRKQIRERAEGVPLYAVETVRMLIDKGLLVRSGEQYRPSGPITSLDVPETLHALIAARLDGLPSAHRHLLQTASVLGKTFTPAGLEAISGAAQEEVGDALAALTRKEFLVVQADPRSPEHGQYGFVQAMMKTVAYETLSRKDRKVLHLAAAQYLQDSWGGDEDEIVEVVASHYLDAYNAAPEAQDAAAIRGKAKDQLVRAGQRASALAATEEAQRYFDRATELTDDEAERAGLQERAGQTAWIMGHQQEAVDRYESAIAAFTRAGEGHHAARVSARIAEIVWADGRIEEATKRLEEAFAVLETEEPDEDVAAVAAQIGRLKFFQGDLEDALKKCDFALRIAEARFLPEVISMALNTKSLAMEAWTRPEEALGLRKHALELALEHDLTAAALRAYFNLSYSYTLRGELAKSADHDARGLALARRLGNRNFEWSFLGHQAYASFFRGEWDEVVRLSTEIPRPDDVAAAKFAWSAMAIPLSYVWSYRGETAKAWEAIRFFEGAEKDSDLQLRSAYCSSLGLLRLVEGRADDALTLGRIAFDAFRETKASDLYCCVGLAVHLDAALELGREADAESALAAADQVPEVERRGFITAHLARARGRRAAAAGDPSATEQFLTATAEFERLAVPFWKALTQLEHAEWLHEQGRPDEAEILASEAAAVFERVRTPAFLERARRLEAVSA